MDPDRQVIGVFGANGFIGRAITRRLAAHGRRVVAFGRSFAPDFAMAVGDEVETRLMNFNDILAVQAIMQDVTHVIQLVNSSSPSLGNSRMLDDIQANLLPHVAFIESCLMGRVSTLVFISSGGTVYGEPAYLPIDEAHPLRPINSYGLTKMAVEKYLWMLSRSSEMSAISLRVSNPFGPGQTLKKGQGLIASILQNHSRGVPTTIFGDGSVERDFIYIEDVLDAIELALDAPAMHDEINIGSGVGRSVRDVITAVERALGTTLAVEYTAGRATDTRSNILNCDKAARILGWHAKSDFDQALLQTVRA